jgi:hypothetical protein
MSDNVSKLNDCLKNAFKIKAILEGVIEKNTKDKDTDNSLRDAQDLLVLAAHDASKFLPFESGADPMYKQNPMYNLHMLLGRIKKIEDPEAYITQVKKALNDIERIIDTLKKEQTSRGGRRKRTHRKRTHRKRKQCRRTHRK